MQQMTEIQVFAGGLVVSIIPLPNMTHSAPPLTPRFKMKTNNGQFKTRHSVVRLWARSAASGSAMASESPPSGSVKENPAVEALDGCNFLSCFGLVFSRSVWGGLVGVFFLSFVLCFIHGYKLKLSLISY